MCTRISVSTLFLLLCTAAVARARPDMKELMKTTVPGPEHRLLEAISGMWNYSLTSYMEVSKPSNSSGTAKGEMMLGGRFARFESTGKVLGRDFSTFWLVGFDRRRDKYFIVECNDMGTHAERAEGTYDEASKTLTLNGKDDEEGVPFRFIFRLIDSDHMSFSFVIDMNGGTMKVIEIDYTRA